MKGLSAVFDNTTLKDVASLHRFNLPTLRRRSMRVVVIFAFATVLFPIFVGAQATIPPKATGTIAISYVHAFVDQHLFGTGENYRILSNGVKTSDLGTLRSHAIYADFGYSITDKLAFSVSLPFIIRKYTAPENPLEPGLGKHQFKDGSIPLDDGDYHGSFQDLAFRVRYNLWTRPFYLTPFIEYNTPTNNYLFYSHAIVGNHVHQLNLGTYIGGLIDPVLPNTYVEARYAVVFPEEVLGISRTRQNADVNVTYFISPTWSAFGLLVGEVTHGGINLPQGTGLPRDTTNPLFFHHAQISRDNILNIGGGIQYAYNDTINFYGAAVHTITARNMHALKYEITAGMSWGFGGSPQRPCHC
jgi:hypothetical protein